MISNPASSTIRIQQALNSDRAFIMGRVVDSGCGADALQAPGVEGVRVYLEDGRYSVTDKEGKYHFEDVAPGTHVVQLDTDSISDTLEPMSCERRQPARGTRLLAVRGRARRLVVARGFQPDHATAPGRNVSLSLDRDVSAQANGTQLGIDVTVDGVAVGNLKALVMLPDRSRT